MLNEYSNKIYRQRKVVCDIHLLTFMKVYFLLPLICKVVKLFLFSFALIIKLRLGPV